MEMKEFKPYPGKGFAWGVGLGLFVGLITLGPIIINLLSKSNPVFLSVMGLVFILTAGLFIYFAWAAKNLRYILDEKELVIKWAFNTKRVPYESIRGVRRTIGSSSMKVVGASLPGLHIGSFTNPGGKGSVNLFATRLWGGILLIRSKWEIIGITPENEDDFLEELNRRVPVLEADNLSEADTGVEAFSPWKEKRFLGLIGLTALIFIAAAIFLMKSIPGLPARIPMHYNLAGEVDRYGSPNELWVPFGIGFIITLFLTALTGVMARNNKTSAYLLAFTGLFLAVLFSVISISMVISS